MAKAVAGYNPVHVQGGKLSTSETAANVKQGLFAGFDSSGDIRLADYRASQGPRIAVGAFLQDAVTKDPLGNVLSTGTRLSFTEHGKLTGMTDVSAAALTAGSLYYLSSNGEVTKTKPASATNDIDQAVGVAMSTSELKIQLGQPLVHA